MPEIATDGRSSMRQAPPQEDARRQASWNSNWRLTLPCMHIAAARPCTGCRNRIRSAARLHRGSAHLTSGTATTIDSGRVERRKASAPLMRDAHASAVPRLLSLFSRYRSIFPHMSLPSLILLLPCPLLSSPQSPLPFARCLPLPLQLLLSSSLLLSLRLRCLRSRS